MPHYHWKGITKVGETVKGTSSVSSVEHLKEQLFQDGVALLSYKQKLHGNAQSRLSPLTKKVSPNDLISFFHGLTILVQSGIPLIKALRLSKAYTQSKRLKLCITSLVNDIEYGTSLWQALAQHKTLFSPMIIHLIQSGEASGNLEQALSILTNHLEKKHQFIKKMHQAAMMPAVTLIFALGIIGALFIFVVPQLEPLLQSIPEKPYLTTVVLAVGRFFESEAHRVAILLLLCGGLLASKLAKRYARYQQVKDRLILSIPYIGSMVAIAAVTRSMQTLSFLLRAGTPLQQAFPLASNVASNSVIQKQLQRVSEYLTQGKSLEQAFRAITLPHQLHEIFAASIALGEESGNVHLMLEKTVSLLEERVDASIDTVATLFQPLLIVTLGLFIAGIMLSIYIPLFDTGKIFA